MDRWMDGLRMGMGMPFHQSGPFAEVQRWKSVKEGVWQRSWLAANVPMLPIRAADEARYGAPRGRMRGTRLRIAGLREANIAG